MKIENILAGRGLPEQLSPPSETSAQSQPTNNVPMYLTLSHGRSMQTLLGVSTFTHMWRGLEAVPEKNPPTALAPPHGNREPGALSFLQRVENPS